MLIFMTCFLISKYCFSVWSHSLAALRNIKLKQKKKLNPSPREGCRTHFPVGTPNCSVLPIKCKFTNLIYLWSKVMHTLNNVCVNKVDQTRLAKMLQSKLTYRKQTLIHLTDTNSISVDSQLILHCLILPVRQCTHLSFMDNLMGASISLV